MHVVHDLYAHMVCQPSRFGFGYAVDAEEASTEGILGFSELYYEAFTSTYIPNWNFVKDELYRASFINGPAEWGYAEFYAVYSYSGARQGGWQDYDYFPVEKFVDAANSVGYNVQNLSQERLEAYLHAEALALFFMVGYLDDFSGVGGVLGHPWWDSVDILYFWANIGDDYFNICDVPVLCDLLEDYVLPQVISKVCFILNFALPFFPQYAHEWPYYFESTEGLDILWNSIPSNLKTPEMEEKYLKTRALVEYYENHTSIKQPNLRSSYSDEISKILQLKNLYKMNLELGPQFLDYKMEIVEEEVDLFNLSRKSGLLGGMYPIESKEYYEQPGVFDMHNSFKDEYVYSNIDIELEGGHQPIFVNYDLNTFGKTRLKIMGRKEDGSTVELTFLDMQGPSREKGNFYTNGLDVVNQEVVEVSYRAETQHLPPYYYFGMSFDSDYRETFNTHPEISDNQYYKDLFKDGDPTRTTAEDPLQDPQNYWPYVLHITPVLNFLATLTDLQATPVSYGCVDLNWSDNSTHNTGYKVRYKVEGESWQIPQEQPEGDVNYFQVKGLEPQTKYYFSVKAYGDDDLESEWSDESNPIFTRNIRNFTAIPMNKAVQLEWKTPDPTKTPFGTYALIVRFNEDGINWGPVDGVIYNEGDEVSPGDTIIYIGFNEQEFPYKNACYDDELENHEHYYYKCFAFSEFPEDPDDPYYTSAITREVVPAVYMGENVCTQGNNSPKIAVSTISGVPGSEVIHVVYGLENGYGNYSPCYLSSTDQGNTWNGGPGGIWGGVTGVPSIAVRDFITENDSIIKVVVFDMMSGGDEWDIFYSYYDENFEWWSYPHCLSSSQYAHWPSMVIENDTAYISWVQYQEDGHYSVKFRYRNIDEIELSETENIPHKFGGIFKKSFPSIALSRVNGVANLHIVYQWGTGNACIGKIAHSYREKVNGSWKWTYDDEQGWLQLGAHPSLVAGSDNTLYLVYATRKDFSNNNKDQIVFRYYNGEVWSDIEIVSDLQTYGPSGYSEYYPNILYHNDNCYIVWEEPSASSDYEIFYRERNSEGEWSNKVNISNLLTSCRWPSIAFTADYSKIYTFWSLENNGDAVFRTIKLIPSVIVSCPTSEDEWQCGKDEHITWEAEDNTEGLIVQSIEYSTNGGTEWTTIASEEENDGDYLWTVPNTLSENCKIRITVRDHSGNVVNAESDIFTIFDEIPPEVSLISPNGGQHWNIGDIEMVRWQALDNVAVSSQHLYYSEDEGDNWEEIEIEGAIQQQNGEYVYSWTIPVVFSDECRIKVETYDFAGNRGEDISDYNFTIWDYEPPEVTILEPYGGEEWEIKTYHTIKWQATDNVNVTGQNLYYSINDGGDWNNLSHGLIGQEP